MPWDQARGSRGYETLTGEVAMNESLKAAVQNGRRSLRGVKPSTLVSLAGGYALGALTNIYPVPSVVLFGSVTVLVGIVALLNFIRSSQVKVFTAWELSLRDPSNDAAAAVARSNEHYLVIAQAIEIIPHPQLNSRAALTDLGWNPAEVDLMDRQTRFGVEVLLDKAGGLKSFDPPNGMKFSLVETSYVTSDSPRLSLSTERTDYFTLRSILPLVTGDRNVREEFGSLEPSRNRIPHSLCLHFVVRFANGDVLAMRRDRRAAYHGGLWSFSGEEQVADHDFKAGTPCLALFQRTFCEEVLALRDEAPLEERWQIASPVVEKMALWSVFLEEGIHNYSLLGFYQLNCNPDDFLKLHNSLVDQGIGTRDREGECFLVRDEDLLYLLVDGYCRASPLFQGRVSEVRAENLHPTSRYRIFRLLRALKRGPLQVDDYVVREVSAGDPVRITR